jgi:hypothetical protein
MAPLLFSYLFRPQPQMFLKRANGAGSCRVIVSDTDQDTGSPLGVTKGPDGIKPSAPGPKARLADFPPGFPAGSCSRSDRSCWEPE